MWGPVVIDNRMQGLSEPVYNAAQRESSYGITGIQNTELWTKRNLFCVVFKGNWYRNKEIKFWNR